MTSLALVMPMAGRGSRFTRVGFSQPKPLVPLAGKPFFEWAVESVVSKVAVHELVFVVLREHIRQFAIDDEINQRYPQARIVAIDDVTSGAAETAAIGIAALSGPGPFAVNDCDHAFDPGDIAPLVESLRAKDCDAAIAGFRASSAGFSYVRFDPEGRVSGTVEKEVVSPYAIAGCYFFADAESFTRNYDAYRADCPYDELFISGIYNKLIDAGGSIAFHELRRHLAFGTPEELALVDPQALRAAVAEGKP